MSLTDSVTRHGTQSVTSWTPERFARAKKLWADGYSATKIADDLGGITRNAVIGKIAREGLPRRKSTVMAGTHAIERRRDGGTGSLRSIELRAMTGTRKLPQPSPVNAEFLCLTLMELEPGQCRFPRGERPTLFCGQPQKDGSPYCPYCHSIAYRRSDAS